MFRVDLVRHLNDAGTRLLQICEPVLEHGGDFTQARRRGFYGSDFLLRFSDGHLTPARDLVQCVCDAGLPHGPCGESVELGLLLLEVRLSVGDGGLRGGGAFQRAVSG